MSTNLRVHCVKCDVVDVSLDDARLETTPDMTGAGVVFVCPSCGTAGRMDVDDRAIRLLLAADLELVLMDGDGVGAISGPDSSDRDGHGRDRAR